jgi:hypothetical protein
MLKWFGPAISLAKDQEGQYQAMMLENKSGNLKARDETEDLVWAMSLYINTVLFFCSDVVSQVVVEDQMEEAIEEHQVNLLVNLARTVFIQPIGWQYRWQQLLLR